MAASIIHPAAMLPDRPPPSKQRRRPAIEMKAAALYDRRPRRNDARVLMRTGKQCASAVAAAIHCISSAASRRKVQAELIASS
jgi:hypothetical protein